MIIETKNLTKRYGQITAVDNLSLKIKEGEVFGLLGPNGAGKTTTLSMLATLVRPTSGTGYVNGYEITKQSDLVRKSIGMVFQDPSSDDILTGRENLYLHALMYGVKREKIKERINEVLELVDLKDRQNDLVKKYSGGMRRRLELARGLLHEPKILFLDEPTLGLDPQTREHIWNYIEKLSKEQRVTIIITTHYMEEADRLCNKVAIIDSGKIVVLNTPEKLKKIIGGDILTLKIKNPNLEAVKKLRYVKKVEKKNGSVVLTVMNAGAHTQNILETIGKVESIELRPATLNDVFLHYTGKEIRDNEAEGGFFERVTHYRSGR